MRLLIGFALILVASGCAPRVEQLESSADKPLADSESPDLPNDASVIASRLESCMHFAGEFNGDRSERDKEVAVAMAELRCDTIDADVAALRIKYPGNTAVIKALDTANEL